jgi:hypothetical protein
VLHGEHRLNDHLGADAVHLEEELVDRKESPVAGAQGELLQALVELDQLGVCSIGALEMANPVPRPDVTQGAEPSVSKRLHDLDPRTGGMIERKGGVRPNLVATSHKFSWLVAATARPLSAWYGGLVNDDRWLERVPLGAALHDDP